MIRLLFLHVIIILWATNVIFAQERRITNPFRNSVDHWVVTVNKDSAPTYKDKACTMITKTVLVFTESYFVTNYFERNEELYSIRLELGPGKYIWFKAEDLLITQSCIMENGSALRLLFTKYSGRKDHFVEFFSSPKANQTSGPLRHQIFYIYDFWPKRDTNGYEIQNLLDAEYLLLGIDSQIDRSSVDQNAKNVLIGWIKRDSSHGLLIGNLRFGLRPNLSKISIHEKKKNQIFASVLPTTSDALRWSEMVKPVSAPLWTDQNMIGNQAQFTFEDLPFIILDIDRRRNHEILEVSYPEIGLYSKPGESESTTTFSRFQRGYVSMDHYKLKSPPWEVTVLLSTIDCYRIWKVSEEILDIIDNPTPGSKVTVLLRELFSIYTGEALLYKNLAQFRGICRQLPAGSRFVSEFLTEGINFIDQMSLSELREFKGQILQKKTRIRNIYQELVEQNGFLIGHEYYQWVKLSDIP